jgi:hypothetical protein
VITIPQSLLLSNAWGAFEQALRKEIEELREQNDASLPVERTAQLRGEIAFAKRLLAASKEASIPKIKSSTPDHYTA